MTYDPTDIYEVAARDVKTGSYLHRVGHPTVNIGMKRWKDKKVHLGLVTPPRGKRTNNVHADYTMKTFICDPDELLRISMLP